MKLGQAWADCAAGYWGAVTDKQGLENLPEMGRD
jgi:hypothetical protein